MRIHPKKEKKDAYLTIRISYDLLERFRNATGKLRQPISKVLRELIRRYIEKVESL